MAIEMEEKDKMMVEFSTDTVTVQSLPQREFAERKLCKGEKGSLQNQMVSRFESFFYWLGSVTSRKPLIVIAVSFLFAALGCAGLPFIKTENNAIKLWIPQESDFSLNYAWLWSNFPPEIRQHSAILHGDDILTPEAIQKMYAIYKAVYNISVEMNKTWEDFCLRIPVVNIDEIIAEELDTQYLNSDEEVDTDLNIDEELDTDLNIAEGLDTDLNIDKIIDEELDTNLTRRRRRAQWDDSEFDEDFEEGLEENRQTDYSVNDYPVPYCGKVTDLPTQCYQDSLLELWADQGEFNAKSDRAIASLTKQQIIDKINKPEGYSEFYMTEKDFKGMLGGIELDDEGRIIKASATKMSWMGRMNSTRALLEGGKDDAGTGEMVDLGTDEFEQELARVLLGFNQYKPSYLKVEVNVANSFGEIASSTIWGDVNNLIIGFSIVFIYVNLMLGKFNQVEQRGYLSLIGLASVGMSIGFSYGFCSLIGLAYGPLHNIIPFLLLGIGIDDMFVTVQCYNNLDTVQERKPLHERFGLTLKQAGCAITVTSLTDFLAFAIGGSTVLPALKSFCIFCAVGLIVVYLLQATWFVAWFSLDQRRIEAGRNGSVICYVHKDFKPNKFSQKNILQSLFQKLANMVVKTPVKIAIIISTLGILGVSIWGNILLRQEFNPIWFLPPESYLAQWHKYSSTYFPSQGEKVTVFMENLDLPSELNKLDWVHKELENQTDIIVDMDSWYLDFKHYVNKHFLDGEGLPEETLDKEFYNKKLTQFLYSQTGSRHRLLINFQEELTCGEPASPMNLSTISFTHRLMSGPKEQIPAMNRVKSILAKANFTNRVFPMCIGYASWETDEVISEELYRNIALAILSVFLTTWLLLFNLMASLQVLGCVVLTLVNVGGFVHFWGLTIDTVSCTNIIISIGLCVDYSAHIAHAFMAATGEREERVKSSLADIGPAVLNGGFSTFLAFVLLAGSKSHVFSSFFKIFFLVVIFGLFNGLLVLPVMLSLIGPPSYIDDKVHVNALELKEPLNKGQNGVIVDNH